MYCPRLDCGSHALRWRYRLVASNHDMLLTLTLPIVRSAALYSSKDEPEAHHMARAVSEIEQEIRALPDHGEGAPAPHTSGGIGRST